MASDDKAHITLKKNNAIQNLLYLVIIIAVTIGIIHLSPTMQNKPHGIFLPATKTQLSPISPEAVKVYTFMSMPSKYTHLGIIRTTIHYTSTEHANLQANFQQMISYAQTLAAKHGANGIVYNQPIIGGPPTYTLDMIDIAAIKTP